MSMSMSMSTSISIGYLDSMCIPSLLSMTMSMSIKKRQSILSMSMSILIPRYHHQLNNIEFLKLAAVAEWIK